MSLGIRSLHDSWTCGCFRCFVLLVPIADVKHCAEVCEWFLCIRMERRRARHALGEKGVAGDFACDRYWLGQILATPRIACSSVPTWCTREALIATEWVVFWTWSLGPFWCTSMPNVWPLPKSWKVGCAMFSPFRLHVLGILFKHGSAVFCCLYNFNFFGDIFETQSIGRKKRCHNTHGKLKRSCVSPFATCHLRVLLHSAVVAPFINSWSKKCNLSGQNPDYLQCISDYTTHVRIIRIRINQPENEMSQGFECCSLGLKPIPSLVHFCCKPPAFETSQVLHGLAHGILSALAILVCVRGVLAIVFDKNLLHLLDRIWYLMLFRGSIRSVWIC